MMPVGGTAVPAVVDRDTAIADLFDREYRKLLRLAALLVDDRASAEDVVQEAFVKVYRAWDRAGAAESPAAYLRTVVVNTARSRLRHLRVVRKHEPEPLRAAGSAEERVMLTEEQLVVIEALRSLPRRPRECLALRFYMEMSEREIAEALGISAGAVKSYTSRGLAALASVLEAKQ